MGQSTDGILFYGFPIDEDDENHEILTSPEEGEDDVDEDERWKKAFGLKNDESVWKHQEKHPVKLGTHCSCDYPMYYVAVSKSTTSASRGYPEQIKSFEVDPKWDAQLVEFCRVFKLKPPKKFGWWLVSNWC